MIKMRLLASLFALVLFSFMANPCIGTSDDKMIVVFKGDKTVVPYELNNGTIMMVQPRAFRVPAFVGGVFNNKEFLVLLCDARYDGFSDWSFIEPAVKTSYGDYTKWSAAKIVVKNSRANMTHSVLGDLTAVIKDNKIYVLAPSWDVSPTAWVLHYEMYHEDYTGWNPFMIVGTVKSRTVSGDVNEMYVEWDKKTSLKHLLPNTALGKDGVQFIGGVGNGVVTKKGAIVFPIQIADKRSDYASSIMYSTDNGITWKMGGLVGYYLSECSVTEWGDGKLILSARYDDGLRLVFESDDMGKTWKESTMFSRVWGNQEDRREVGSQGSLITVPVDGKDVLLFAHPLNTLGGYTRDTLYLWMSDGQRIMSVGTISEKGKGERSGYSILGYVGDKLYIVHEINPFGEWSEYNNKLTEWDRVIAISPLPKLLKRIKLRLGTWKTVDAELNAKSVPTNGLVGFLVDCKKKNLWSDKYRSVTAYVIGGTNVTGGFRFDGTQGSGAHWPVRTQGQNVFYIFTEIQFTLAATVTIHSKSTSEDVPLFGASDDFHGKKVVIGLGYTKDNKWYVDDYYGVKKPIEVSFNLDQEYHIAITYANEKASVYVDGVSIKTWKIPHYDSTWIDHLYIGGIYKSTYNGCLCTVKNVMLFNRVLSKTEVNQIQYVDKRLPPNTQIINNEERDTLPNPKSTPIIEKTGTLDAHTSTSTKGQTGTLKNTELTPTIEKTVTSENNKSTTTKEQTKTLDAPKSTSTIGNTDTLKNTESTPPIENTGTSENNKSPPEEESTKTLDTHTSTSTMGQTDKLKHPELTPNVEPTNPLKNPIQPQTIEQTEKLENAISTSTVEQTNPLRSNESTSNVKQSGELENSEPTLQVEQTKTVEHSPPTSKVDTKETLVESTSTPMDDTESADTLEDLDITPDLLPDEIFVNPISGPKMNPKEKETARWRTIPKKDRKVNADKRIFKTITSTTENPKPNNKNCDGDYCDLQNNSNGGDSKKGQKGVDGAVGSISFTFSMCLVYSAILLAGL